MRKQYVAAELRSEEIKLPNAKSPIKFILFTVLFSFIIVSVGLAQSNPNIASVNNMIDDAVDKAVASLINVAPEIKTIAIWSIETSSESPIDVASIRKKLTKALIKANNFSRFTVIDETALQIRVSQLNMEFSRVIDRSKMIEIGNALNIDAFLYGSAALEDEEVILTLNLVDTKTGTLAWLDEIRGQDQVLIARREQEAEAARLALERDQAMKKLKSEMDGALRSLLVPGLGQFYTENNSRGITYLFIEGIAWLAVIQSLASDGNTIQEQIGLAIIGANHLVSAIDAGLSAHQYNAQLKSKYNLSLESNRTPPKVLLTYRYYF